jgi:aminocarboxymuconate-semialdehyde decarboxylase
MKTSEKCSRAEQLSRRNMLKAGLSAAAAVAIGQSAESFAESQAQGQSRARRAVSTEGVRSIDIHAHYYPQTYLEAIAEDGKRFDCEYRMTDQGFYTKTPAGNQGPLPTKFIDLKQRIAEMDTTGVAVQAISLTTPMNYWGDAEISLQLAKTWNDGASAAHLAFPTRLVAFLTLPMLYPDHAVDELNRASKLPGMRGVYLGTNIEGRDLDDPLFEPVFARIEALDLPVFLHPLTTLGGNRTKPYYLSNLLGNPFETAVAACHLIFGGVLDRHPKLQVNLPHGGGALPILIGRLDHGWQVRSEFDHVKMPNPPSTYLQRFTYDTIVHSKSIMEFVIREVGAERVMVGSDYCFDMGVDRPLQFLEQINLPNAQRKMILGENAARILKL